VTMKRTSVALQSDMFNGVPAPPVVSSLQHNHDELVNLLSSLLWEVIVDPQPQATKENTHEQDQR